MRANYTLPRLYLDQPLSGEIELSREHAHYFGTVLRKSVGDCVRLFNARDGEWSAQVAEKGRKSMRLEIMDRLRDPQPVPDIRLLFAPLRKHRLNIVIEKATELGVRTLQPVLTTHTQFPSVNVERAQAQIIEAAEQTEPAGNPCAHTPVGCAGGQPDFGFRGRGRRRLCGRRDLRRDLAARRADRAGGRVQRRRTRRHPGA